MFLRAPYNYDVDAASDESGLCCEDPSLAQQHEEPEANINRIVERFMSTGVLPQVEHPPTYGDFAIAMDYAEAMNLIRKADQSFMSLPPEVRLRFGNQPDAFLRFVEEASLEELQELGLAERKPAPKESEQAGDGNVTA